MPAAPPYRELVERWRALRAGGARVREVACVGAPRTLLCVELGDPLQPAIALAAGVHGDEPAGPSALLQLVENDALDPRFAYRIWPCMNPTGYDAGTRESVDGIDLNRTFGRGGTSPEARAIVTANRDRRWVCSFDLHEDCDAAGFYCYEYGGGALGRSAVAALDAAGVPVDPLGSSAMLIAPEADGALARERGRCFGDAFAEAAHLPGLSYSLAIARRAARHTLTFETPSGALWDERLLAHRMAVIAVIAELSQTFVKVTNESMFEK
jgi:hypothetical protein